MVYSQKEKVKHGITLFTVNIVYCQKSEVVHAQVHDAANQYGLISAPIITRIYHKNMVKHGIQCKNMVKNGLQATISIVKKLN